MKNMDHFTGRDRDSGLTGFIHPERAYILLYVTLTINLS